MTAENDRIRRELGMELIKAARDSEARQQQPAQAPQETVQVLKGNGHGKAEAETQ